MTFIILALLSAGQDTLGPETYILTYTPGISSKEARLLVKTGGISLYVAVKKGKKLLASGKTPLEVSYPGFGNSLKFTGQTLG